LPLRAALRNGQCAVFNSQSALNMVHSSMQHQPRMLTNASFLKQQISIGIGTVSWQEVTSIRTIALQTPLSDHGD